MVDVTEIEKRTDLVRASAIPIGKSVGNVLTESVAEVIKMAELFARSDVMVPPHCRNYPGRCFALCIQALEWRMPYLGVMNKSYITSNRGVERIAYESQLLHAVVERNAPLKSRLRYEIIGEGDDRRCKVWGTFKGEKDPHVYLSETLAKLREARGRNADGVLKGSPLWEHQPEVQLFYSASRQWARLFCPDVLLGAYTPEDPQWLAAEEEPVIPPILQRLRGKEKAGDRGFDLDRVSREHATIIEGELEKADGAEGSERHAGHEGRAGDDGGGKSGADDQAGGAGLRGGDQALGGEPPGAQEASAEKAGEGKPGEARKPKAKGKP
jgi:hypothetical protein